MCTMISMYANYQVWCVQVYSLSLSLTSSGLKSSATGEASSRDVLNSFDLLLFSLTVTDLRTLVPSSLRPKGIIERCQTNA